jgi:hypothetical protein
VHEKPAPDNQAKRDCIPTWRQRREKPDGTGDQRIHFRTSSAGFGESPKTARSKVRFPKVFVTAIAAATTRKYRQPDERAEGRLDIVRKTGIIQKE